jgi:RNA polymerase sigma factor (sigma-70 family)
VETQELQDLQLSGATGGGRTYDAYIGPIQTAVRKVARQYRLSSPEADDLLSDVWLKVLGHDGRAMLQYRGESGLQTYLTRIAKNALLDTWIRDAGKWRPSAIARRAGPLGIMADRLLVREALTPEETLARLSALAPGTDCGALLNQLLAGGRRTRRRFVDLACVEDAPANSPTPFDQLCARHDARTKQRLGRQVRTMLAELPSQDRSALEDRFVRNRPLATVAARHGVPAPVFYRNFAALLRRLRRRLA